MRSSEPSQTTSRRTCVEPRKGIVDVAAVEADLTLDNQMLKVVVQKKW
jgi:hypothetical protein